MCRILFSVLLLVFVVPVASGEEKKLPPGWLPLNALDDQPEWREFRKIDDKVHLYLPAKAKNVRGVFVCFVFHSSDPRELARLWDFALVTIPWPFEFDLGVNDKRSGRYKLGHPVGDMGVLLSYLETAAKQTKHPELTTVPIVGWLGQNGARTCGDLYKRVPDRVLAWGDSWYPALPKNPEMIANVPFAAAWEFNNEKQRRTERESSLDKLKDKPTPAPDLSCFATTYGFGHGIYSKYNFFALFLDRCIQARMPDEMPEPGKPVKLKPIDRTKGWAGDFNEISEWNAIAPMSQAKGMIAPTWMPDAYAAWAWRSYHSAKPDIKIAAPVVEYRKNDGKWGGKECGLGYGGELAEGKELTFAAETKGDYEKVEFHDGDKIVATATKLPWKVEGVKLKRGLHALFAVGVRKDGTRAASRPAFLVVVDGK